MPTGWQYGAVVLPDDSIRQPSRCKEGMARAFEVMAKLDELDECRGTSYGGRTN